MKNLCFPLIGIILVAILFAHCSKEKTPDPPPPPPPPVVVKYNLSVTVSPASSGSVSPSSGSYAKGTSVTLTPTPATGYDFKEWSGSGITSSVTPLTFAMNQDMNINATFQEKTYSLNISIVGEGQVGQVENSQKSTTTHGTTYTLTAVPADGWEFLEWRGDLTGNTNPVQITVVGPTTIICVFQRIMGTTSTFTDSRDGQSYATIEIGSQVWMAENLNFETSDSWWYDDDSANGDIYGRLYTWDAAITACPSGWHLPSDDEWKQLEMYLGMDQSEADKEGFRGTNEGSKLKSSSAWNGTESSGFNALPGGLQHLYDNVRPSWLLIDLGQWWSSTEHQGTNAWSRMLKYTNDRVARYSSYKGWYGMSVRCLKD